MQISTVLGNGMVLQREVQNPVWGYTRPGEKVQLIIGEHHLETQSDKDGYFEILLPSMKAGGPWEIRLWDTTGRYVFQDVLFGDVFLLGGQSNMELPLSWIWDQVKEELAEIRNEQIRMFDLPKEYDFLKKRELLTQGKWVSACGKDLLAFSAAGYYAAAEIHKKENIPIGLLQAAVGGTPVKAWVSEETIRRQGYYEEELERCRDEKWVENTIAFETEREQCWWNVAKASFEKEIRYHDVINIPGFFTGDLKKYIGSISLKKEFRLQEEDLQIDGIVKLYLGAIVDADIVYINGIKVGDTTFRYPPRLYEVDKSVLHEGINEIVIHMFVMRENGGFMPDKAYELVLPQGRHISLMGEWEAATVERMPYLPDMTFFQYAATGLYNGMLYPLRRQKIKGCFFYQGESNTGVADRYEQEFSAMIGEWRSLWNDPSLPFIYVQLAGFSDGILPSTQTDWAVLRSEQLKAEHNKNVCMVQAYDLGEYNDLHPFDKKGVGHRIALACDSLIYHNSVFFKGPCAVDFAWHRDFVEILFETDTPLTVCDGTDRVHGFQTVDETGRIRNVEAKLKSENEVRVDIDERVKVLMYAWNNYPGQANLYSGSHMPAVPFCRKREE